MVAKAFPPNNVFDFETGMMKSEEEIRAACLEYNIDLSREICCYCNSNVMATVVMAAIQTVADKQPCISSQSWKAWSVRMQAKNGDNWVEDWMVEIGFNSKYAL
jgi:3-mercaptopyruvate sulfurtransferase SseA